MDAKILVGGTVGLGLLAIAGILVLNGGPDSQGLTQTNSVTRSKKTLDPGTSAYDTSAIERAKSQLAQTEPRDLQGRRGDGNRDGRGERDGFERMEERMMQFDVDGDGILNQSERDAMAESFRQRMTERFDRDGDGMVSIEEQFAARREFLLDSPRGERMRAEFDVDGDGVLSEAELAEMNAQLDERDAERMAEIISRYDTDHDGLMSPAETLAMQDQEFNERRNQMDEFAMQFDQDGDGNLDADERLNARDTIVQQHEIDSFRRRYDTGNDGTIGAADSERFTDAYGKKEPYADVNRDGIYNMDDVVMFRDMTERVNARDD